MLAALLKPFTTPTAAGTTFRDIFLIVGAVITILGTVGVLSPEQVEALKDAVETISGNWPALTIAVGIIMTAGMSIYRSLFRSQTVQEAKVVEEIRSELEPGAPVEIVTPGSKPNIIVPAAPLPVAKH